MFKDALATLGLGLALFPVGPSAVAKAPSFNFPIDEVRVGTGALVEASARITVHFEVASESGVEYANSRKRGLPFSLVVDPTSTDILARLPEGMRVGGVRKAHLTAELAYGADGLGSLVPPNMPIVVVISVVRMADR